VAEPILKVENLEAGYGEVQVLWGISLGVEAGQLTTIIGANGAGKTTTLRASMGIINPKAGRIILKGEDVTRLPPHAKADRGMVLVPEGRQLFANMTVEENLEMGAYTPRVRANVRKNLDYVYGLFPRLKERRTQKAGTFSGGEQQMLAVARGLMAEPEVLIIDEMSLGLSPLLVQQMFLTLRDLGREGITLLLVEQSVHLALALCDYAYVVAEGRVFLEGPAHEVAQNEEVRTAYLGV
jgi:branched-chain amino acid transport system ATP-binding protein